MLESLQLSVAVTVGASALLYVCGVCGGGDDDRAAKESKWEVVRTALRVGGRKNTRTQASRRAERGAPPAKYSAFMSHAKAEAAMEARFVQMQMEDRQAEGKMSSKLPVFLDSDDLKNLDELEDHVRASEVLVLCQTEKVLTRPWCLLELVTALDVGVPIVGLTLQGKGYDFAEAEHYLANIDTKLDKITPGGSKLLESKGVNMQEAAHKLSNAIPKIISMELNTGASRNVLKATIDDLVETIEGAESPPSPREDFATWIQQRDMKHQQTHAITGRRLLEKAKAIPSLSTIAFLMQAIESTCAKIPTDADDGSSTLASVVPLLEEDVAQLPEASLALNPLGLAKLAAELEKIALHVQTLVGTAGDRAESTPFIAVCTGLKTSIVALGVTVTSASVQALDQSCGISPAIPQASASTDVGQLANSAAPRSLHGDAPKTVPTSPATLLRENQQLVADTAKQQQLLEMQNKVLMEQVAQMQAMMAKQKETGLKLQDALAAHPIPANEAERRITLHETNLMNLQLPNASLDAASQRALRNVSAADKAVIGCVFNVIGEHKQRTVTMAQLLKDGRMFETNRLPSAMLNGEDTQTARKISACQYVVATGEMQCFNPKVPSKMVLPQLPGADGTGTDHRYFNSNPMDVSSKVEHFRTSGIMDTEGAAEDPSQDVSQDLMMVNVFQWLYTSDYKPDEQKGIMGYVKGTAGRAMLAALPSDHREFLDIAMRLMGGDASLTYAGVPVFHEGVVLGSLCFMCDGGMPAENVKEIMKKEAAQLSNDIGSITMPDATSI